MVCPKYIGDVKIPNRLQDYLNSIEMKLMDAAKEDSFFDVSITTYEHVVAALFDISVCGFGLDWLAKLYKNKKFKISDATSYKDILEYYHIVHHTVSGKELFEFKSIADIENFILDKYGQVSKNARLQKIKDEETARIVDSDNFKILSPLTESSAKIYGKTTKWCLSGDFYNEFEQYKILGNSYIIIAEDRKFAFHVEKCSIVNEINEFPTQNDISFLNNFTELLDFLKSLEMNYLSLPEHKFFGLLRQSGFNM